MSQTLMHCEELNDQSSLPELPAEIRFEPIGCSTEVVEKANAAERRTGESVFEPVEVAIERIRTEWSPSQARLDSWARHPDERVPIALLSSKLSELDAERSRTVLSLVGPRAVDETRSRGEIWTPLLDAWSHALHSESVSKFGLLGERYRERGYLDSAVVPWIQRQKDPQLLRRVVLQAKSQPLIGCIGAFATIVDDALLRTALRVYPPVVADFARNNHLSLEQCECLLDGFVATTLSIRKDQMDPSYFERSYRHMAQRGACLRSHHIDRLIESLDNHESQHELILGLINDHVQVLGDEQTALRMIEAAARIKDSYWVLRLIYDSGISYSRLSLTPRLVHTILSYFPNKTDVLEVLAQLPEIRQDPDVRRRLLQSPTPPIMFELARDARPEEFTLLFKRLSSKHPAVAFDLIKKNRDVARSTLTRDDLLPLLQSSSHEVRLGAIAFLGELHNEPERVDSTSPRCLL